MPAVVPALDALDVHSEPDAGPARVALDAPPARAAAPALGALDAPPKPGAGPARVALAVNVMTDEREAEFLLGPMMSSEHFLTRQYSALLQISIVC